MGRSAIAPRFDEFVNRTDGCWLWTGPTDSDGYGMCGRDRAHRVAWRREHAEIPDGTLVCHTCDNPLCVRPDHLFLGTVADNNRDRHAKGRSKNLFVSGESHPATQRRGERHWRARLTDADVREIRRRHGNGERQADIAAAFGNNPATVSRIARGVWRKEVTA